MLQIVQKPISFLDSSIFYSLKRIILCLQSANNTNLFLYLFLYLYSTPKLVIIQ